MRKFRAVTLALLAAFALVGAAVAQTRPTTSPTYIPQGVLSSQTLSTATSSTAFQVNGDGTMYVRVAGTFSGLVATFQGTEYRGSGSATWTTLGVDGVGGVRQAVITAAGLYRVNVAGLAGVRLNITTLGSGSVTLTQIAGAGAHFVNTLPIARATYSVAITALSPAASATDFFTLTGSATKTIRIQRVQCTGIATAIGTAQVLGVMRSTANATGTSLAASVVPADSNNVAATALPQSYTSNPGSLGTIVGAAFRSQYMQLTPTATTTFGAQPLVWQFGMNPGEQEIILRGAAQVFALNGNAASFPSGAAVDCSLTWTEE